MDLGRKHDGNDSAAAAAGRRRLVGQIRSGHWPFVGWYECVTWLGSVCEQEKRS